MTTLKPCTAFVLLPLMLAACAPESAALSDDAVDAGGGGEGGGAPTTGEEDQSDDGEEPSAVPEGGDRPTLAQGPVPTATAEGDGEPTLSPGAWREDGALDLEGPIPLAIDTCPGEAHALTLDATAISISGTTVGATDALDTCWTEPATDGGERIYVFSLSGPGVLSVALKHDAGFDPALAVRTSCTDSNTEYCHDIGSAGENHKAYTTDNEVFVIVDGKAAAPGGFSLIVSLDASVCGDGVLGPGEACDVGPGVVGDGCGDPGQPNACLVESAAPTSDTCPGELTPIPLGASALLMSAGLTTLGHADDAIGTCMPEVGGHDRVLQLVPAASGILEVRAGMTDSGVAAICQSDPGSPGCFDVELYARTTCNSASPADELACASSCCDGEAITFPVTADVPVFLFVDGYDPYFYSEGPFNLHFDLIAD